MAYEEWNREIPPEEQLQEVAKLIATAIIRVHRNPAPAHSSTREARRGRVDHIATDQPPRERHRLDQAGDRAKPRLQASRPFDDNADIDP